MALPAMEILLNLVNTRATVRPIVTSPTRDRDALGAATVVGRMEAGRAS